MSETSCNFCYLSLLNVVSKIVENEFLKSCFELSLASFNTGCTEILQKHFRPIYQKRIGIIIADSHFSIFVCNSWVTTVIQVLDDANFAVTGYFRSRCYHVFSDLKKTLTEYGTQPYGPNISANLVCTNEQLYDKDKSQVQMNSSIGEWFRTTVGVRQGCFLSPTLFNIFLERIMSDALEEHVGKVSIGGRNITNLRFADDIDA